MIMYKSARPSCPVAQGSVAEIMLGPRRAASLSMDEDLDEKRDALVVKAIMRKLLTGMERLHSLGIVHRDIKPDNIMITGEGEVSSKRIRVPVRRLFDCWHVMNTSSQCMHSKGLLVVTV